MSASDNVTRVRPRGLNSDMLYRIPDVPLSGPSGVKKRQRPKMSGRQKAPSSILSHPWREAENEASQVTNISISNNVTPKHSYHQIELFSGASITKPKLGRMGLITTEDALKSTGFSLNQTTMDTLLSERSQPLSHIIPHIDSLEPVKEANVHESLQHTVNHNEEATTLISNGHGPTSHSIEKFPTVSDYYDHTGFNEQELDREIVCLDPKYRSEQNSYYESDTAVLLDHGDHMITAEKEEAIVSHCKTMPAKQLSTEDDFPIDNDFETGMADLLILHKSCETLAYLHSPVLHNELLQTERVQTQQSRPRSYAILSNNGAAMTIPCNSVSPTSPIPRIGTVPGSLGKAIDSPVTNEEQRDRMSSGEKTRHGTVSSPKDPAGPISAAEEDEYSSLQPFARPPFPSRVSDRSPIIGVSSSVLLRTCFRIGEALREGSHCAHVGQDAIIELFARVKHSSSDIVTPSKLYFEFEDLFHGRRPFLRGTLENNKISGLQESESRLLLEPNGPPPMVRCLGRMKKAVADPPCWMLCIINIRPTDWEEVRWTRHIAGAGMAK